MYARLLINHMLSVWKAHSYGVMDATDPQRENMAHFLRLPIPSLVWRESKSYHKHEFVRFIDDIGSKLTALNNSTGRSGANSTRLIYGPRGARNAADTRIDDSGHRAAPSAAARPKVARPQEH